MSAFTLTELAVQPGSGLLSFGHPAGPVRPPRSVPGRAGEGERALASALLPIPAERAGRIVSGGRPTGAGAGHAMVGSGPFPAATDSRATAAGTPAIERSLRPVARKDVPAALLPAEVCDDDPLGGRRRLDGESGRGAPFTVGAG